MQSFCVRINSWSSLPRHGQPRRFDTIEKRLQVRVEAPEMSHRRPSFTSDPSQCKCKAKDASASL